MNLIGLMYVLGVQVPIDYSKAVDWFQKAIDGGSASAMHNLAQMYLYGIGVPRDYTNAFRWFQRSAAYGNVHSMYSAAVMAENGLGTARDLRVSRALYHDAAESGFAPAMVRVSDELARGAAQRGPKRDVAQPRSEVGECQIREVGGRNEPQRGDHHEHHQ